MRCRISSEVLDALLAEASLSPTKEVCGLLFGSADHIIGHTSCRNVAGEPERAFEIDPAQLIAAYRAERSGGPKIVGCYHSHPQGPPTPSAQDAQTEPNGWLWLILSSGGVGGWRAVQAGARHGRFVSVAMDVVAVAVGD